MATLISGIYAGLSGMQPTRTQAVAPRTRTLGSLKTQQAKTAQQQTRHQARKQPGDQSQMQQKSRYESRFESSFDDDSVSGRR